MSRNSVMANRKAAVLGSPIKHSKSPQLHRAAYRSIAFNGSYEAVEVTEGELAAFIAGLDDSWIGLSLTMPLKEAVLTLVDDVDETATTVRAANTVVFREGSSKAFNTDIDGLCFALDGVDVNRVQILGSGATARSAIAALARMNCAAVTIYTRNETAGHEVAALAESFGIVTQIDPMPERISARDVCISTLPPHAADRIEVDRGTATLLDIAYDPWPSELAQKWTSAGGHVINGLEMLLGQAVAQVELMTGRRPDVAVMRAALNDIEEP